MVAEYSTTIRQFVCVGIPYSTKNGLSSSKNIYPPILCRYRYGSACLIYMSQLGSNLMTSCIKSIVYHLLPCGRIVMYCKCRGRLNAYLATHLFVVFFNIILFSFLVSFWICSPPLIHPFFVSLYFFLFPTFISIRVFIPCWISCALGMLCHKLCLPFIDVLCTISTSSYNIWLLNHSVKKLD